MDNNKYVEAIDEVKDLLSELLNDPDHGKLTFTGLNGLDDLIIIGPQELEDIISGTVLAIGNGEWMATCTTLGEHRYWQSFRGEKVATSDELYICALKQLNRLYYCHKGL